jgi:hypothetical protein
VDSWESEGLQQLPSRPCFTSSGLMTSPSGESLADPLKTFMQGNSLRTLEIKWAASRYKVEICEHTLTSLSLKIASSEGRFQTIFLVW